MNIKFIHLKKPFYNEYSYCFGNNLECRKKFREDSKIGVTDRIPLLIERKLFKRSF